MRFTNLKYNKFTTINHPVMEIQEKFQLEMIKVHLVESLTKINTKQ